MGLENLKSVFNKITPIRNQVTSDSSNLANEDLRDVSIPQRTPFVDETGRKAYQDIQFPSNAYIGARFTRFDNVGGGETGIGGLFNAEIPYSNSFRTINTPTLNEIAAKGNIVTKAGYPTAKAVIDLVDSTRNIPLEKYSSNGQLNLRAGSWFYGGQNSVPQTNNLYTVGGGNETRTINVNTEQLKAQQLGKGDLTFETLYNHDHTSKLNSRLSYNTTNPGFRGTEPYIISNIPKSEGVSGGRLTNFGGRIMPMMRGATDTLRLSKYLISGDGLLFIGKQNVFQAMNARSSQLYREASLYSGIPIGGAIKVRLTRGVGPNTNYTDTLQTNEDDGGVTKFGIINQVLGAKNANRLGLVDFSKVRPGPLIPDPSDFLGTKLKDLLKLTTSATAKFSPRGGPMGLAGGRSETKNVSRFTAVKTPTLGGDPQLTSAKLGPYSQLPIDGKPPGIPPNPTFEKNVPYEKEQINGQTGILPTDVGPGPGYPTKLTPGRRGNGLSDLHTMHPIKDTLDDSVESDVQGMPLYFQDLRDNKYIVLRGYVTGLNEQITPSWAEETYVGRSEPVYIYERATRAISFNIKLIAMTSNELDMIYEKLNRITSFCYPQYKQDALLNSHVRMKPPLLKFRMGELYGSTGKEITGFIDSLTYTFDDQSPWETLKGKRVPKHIDVAVTYKVLHSHVPGFNSSMKYLPSNGFIGYNKGDS